MIIKILTLAYFGSMGLVLVYLLVDCFRMLYKLEHPSKQDDKPSPVEFFFVPELELLNPDADLFDSDEM